MKLINPTKFILKKASDQEEQVEISLDWLLSGIDLVKRRIEIRSEVNEQFASIIFRALAQMEEISHDPITIEMSSPGGEVNQGLAIYDRITKSPCDIHIVASGQIMSMGFIIFLGGDTRTAYPNTSFMMHSISYAQGDNTKIVRHHEIDVMEAKRLNNVLLDIMADRTNRNRKYWYRTVLLADRYFTVPEAVELGIIKENNIVRRKVKKNAKRG